MATSSAATPTLNTTVTTPTLMAATLPPSITSTAFTTTLPTTKFASTLATTTKPAAVSTTVPASLPAAFDPTLWLLFIVALSSTFVGYRIVTAPDLPAVPLNPPRNPRSRPAPHVAL